MKKEKILVTGAAGFIGFHLAKKFLESEKFEIVGLDNLNDYYDVNLKKSRLSILQKSEHFSFVKGDLKDDKFILELFKNHRFKYVFNLAAQAGVRHSLTNPKVYIDSNISGFLNILEACRAFPVDHLIYASSSSVYGTNDRQPFSVDDNVDHPISLYATSKKCNELMAHTYSHLFNIPSTGLRFFTVYGPWGRPDMALFLFTKAILEGKAIDIFNKGNMKRDFTYIDDIVESLFRLTTKVPDTSNGNNSPAVSRTAPYRVLNIGNSGPIKLMEFIEKLEKYLGRTAKKNFMEIQPGDVPETCANVDHLIDLIDFKPKTSVDEGINKFVNWYLNYYK